MFECKLKDRINWSEPVTILAKNNFDHVSPSLIFNHNTFCLFVCAWEVNLDGKEIQGAYSCKAYIYHSDDIIILGSDEEIPILNAYAPEFFQGRWIVASLEYR